MKKDLKAEIIVVARDLFNEKGYNSVSMRDIADVLHISVGNLTYHFKKKEALVEAVVVHHHENYRKVKPPESFEELDAFFNRLVFHHYQHAYYFRHYMQLSELCPKVYEIQLNVIQDLMTVFRDTFAYLKQVSLLKTEFTSEQTEHLIKVLMTVTVYGIPYYEKLQQQGAKESVLDSLRTLVLLCLTEEGRASYEKIIQIATPL